ncbi:MAG: polysaccharide chain length determinant protein [Desulfovibrionales bacterium]|nr:polysaccharide chain length determinant protein [Desulfovibrionales bacterium]
MNPKLYQEIERYLRLLLAKKRLFVALVLAVMTAGVVVSYLLPKKYEAKSTVFIEESVINDLVKGIAITPSMDAKIRVLSLSMLSRESLSKVLRILDKDVGFASDGAFEQYLHGLRDRINIKLEEKKGVFFISFMDKNPSFARDLVNTMTQVYIETNTASKRGESLEATKFLSEQIESFKKRIDVVQDEIDKFKAEHGLELAVDQGSIRVDISNKEKQIAELRLRQQALETQARLLGGGSGGGPLRELENQLAAMRSTYTENHPKVLRLKAQIEAVKSMPGGGINPDGSGASRGMIRAEMENNTQRIAKLEKEIDESMQLLRQIPVIQTSLRELQRKKENETIIYNQLVSRYGQSEVSKQMEMENKSVNFRIVDPAVLPEKPVSPKRVQIMLLSLLAGIGAGIAAVILPYLLSGAIKGVDDLRGLNQRVLAVIPSIPKPEEEERRKRGDRRFLAVAGVYLSMLLAVVVMEALGWPYIENILGRIPGLSF